jgi:tRNA pseudouridine32 synthase/23S rRNA pseudouridine746 synthase
LDFGTSGLMLLALNKAANGHLTKQFQARTVIKTYEATLLGHLVDDEGVVDVPLAKAEFPYQKVCRESGKSAQSHYQVIERSQDSTTSVKTTRVLFSPLTGRTHQLRVHSQEIGHPIIGCDLYGLTIDGVKSQALAKRLMLHAQSLEFKHPDSGERMEFECTIND